MDIESDIRLVFTFIAPVTAGVLALVAIVVAFRLRPTKRSRIGLAAAVFPALLMLASFYSLAIHLHHSLGTWPASIGDRDFPQLLITH